MRAMPVNPGPGMLLVNPAAAILGPGTQPNRRFNPGPATLAAGRRWVNPVVVMRPVNPAAGMHWVNPAADMRPVNRAAHIP